MVLDPDSGDTVQTQFRNMMKEEGYDYRTATHVPFDIDASRVTDLNGLFQDCRNLVRAPEIKWTARVSTAAQMFYGCERLAFVPEFDTSGIQNMTRMFYGCSNLTFVPPLRMFNATTTTYMFANCTALEEVQAMDTSAVKDMSYMFYNCASLRKAPQIHAFSATNLAGMFQACMSLEEVPDMYVNPGVTSMWAMFKDCTMLTDGKVRVFGKPDYTGPMTEGSGLTRNPLYEGNLPVLRLVEEPTGYAGQLQLRRALSAHGLSHGRVTSIPFDIDCSETESIAGLFMDCTSMRTAPNLTLRDEDGVTVADTSNVKNMSYLFANCTSLTSVPPINTNSVETMEAMFGSCRSLRELPDLLTHKTANTMFMFENASNLRDGSVRLIGRRPDLVSTGMIQGSGLTREPFYSPSGSAV